MNQKFLATVVLMLSLVNLGIPSVVSAAPRKPASRAIACPPIVGDKNQSTYYSSRSARQNRFRCFRTAKDAAQEGFLSLSQATKANLSGWYRVSLKLIKDSCTPENPIGGPVLFLQIRETDAGVFGQFCPSLGEFSGISSPSGFVISSLNSSAIPAGETSCDSNLVVDHQYLQLTRVVSTGISYSVKYTNIRRCSDAASGSELCVRDYVGTALHETSKIWPPVGASPFDLPMGCTMAMGNCESCHPALKGLNGPVPNSH